MEHWKSSEEEERRAHRITENSKRGVDEIEDALENDNHVIGLSSIAIRKKTKKNGKSCEKREKN